MIKLLIIIWAVVTVVGLVTMAIAAKNAPIMEDISEDDNDYDLEMSEEDWDYYFKMVK